MGIDTRHPLYLHYLPDWELLNVAYAGERAVKAAGTRYLPPTSGMIEDGCETNPESRGRKAYDAYKLRAVFPDVVSEAVEGAIGIMHNKPPVIELPPQLEFMREKATVEGENLEQLLRRINEQQLVYGRLGLLLDMPNVMSLSAPQLYIAMYSAPQIINWDNGTRAMPVLQSLNLVILDESEYERGAEFAWDWKKKYRVLVLGDPTENEADGTAYYRAGQYREGTSYADGVMEEPSIRGTKLETIPFVCINSKDVLPAPDDPPLLGLANLAMAIYRGEADYRQNLFMQGQDTLVLLGDADDDQVRTGANAVIRISNPDGDAKFIGVSSTGLAEQRQAIENDKRDAQSKGGKLLDTTSREKESGEALQIRVAAQTATLNQIALAGAFGLERLLKMAALWMGADPEKVVVTPNLDFADTQMTGQSLTQIMTAKGLGAPFSLESIHELMQKRGMTEKTFDEEMAAIEAEEPNMTGTDAGGDEAPTDNEEDAPADDEDD